MSEPATESGRVGFVGLGRMGQAMALNLVAAGFDTTVFNRTAARAEPVVAAGATLAASPRELSAGCEVVVTMIADPAAAEAVFGGEGGILAGAHPGQKIVEMSTLGPALVLELGERVAATGAELLDAPVSGSIPAAEAATLLAMVGGDSAAFERVRPVLAAMTREQLHLGPLGSGAAMKLVVNGMLGVVNLALSEALVLAERAGIERERAYDVLASGAVAAPFVKYKREAFLDPDGVEQFFTIDLLQKDLELALAMARQVRSPLLAVAAANEALTLAAAAGYAQGDVNRVADALRGERAPGADES